MWETLVEDENFSLHWSCNWNFIQVFSKLARHNQSKSRQLDFWLVSDYKIHFVVIFSRHFRQIVNILRKKISLAMNGKRLSSKTNVNSFPSTLSPSEKNDLRVMSSYSFWLSTPATETPSKSSQGKDKEDLLPHVKMPQVFRVLYLSLLSWIQPARKLVISTTNFTDHRLDKLFPTHTVSTNRGVEAIEAKSA